jgi:hypothetical protein
MSYSDLFQPVPRQGLPGHCSDQFRAGALLRTAPVMGGCDR